MTTTNYHPPDCTCYACLQKMADPKCKDCDGDGYTNEGHADAMCPCVVPAHLKRLEKAGIIQPESQVPRKGE